MWYKKSVFYQIYPLGLCGAPHVNDDVLTHRINSIQNWIPHIKELGANAVYFSPLFESDSHGYDTRDFYKIDARLGTNEDFKHLCQKFHEQNIKIVLDGVFNHVGRGFWAFKKVIGSHAQSDYNDWFYIDPNKNSNYNDGFWYEGWEGHFELVKLNLKNEQVINHILDAVKYWIEEFDIDGLRLDVAYCLDADFIKRLRTHCKSLKNDFFLLGEMLHGDYKRLVNCEMLDSATNYECYKGLYSAFNSKNLFEIGHSLSRQFGPEEWTLYKGLYLFNFADNHDVSRIAAILQNPNHIKPLYGLLFAMPGIPCIYYGSEWGIQGDKNNGDNALRPAIEAPVSNELSTFISKLSAIKKNSKALCFGNYRTILLTNEQYIFERRFEDERILIAINSSENEFTAHFDAGAGLADELISNAEHDFGGGSKLPPYSVKYWRTK